VIRLNRRNAARAAEQRYPQFEERLLTFSERAWSESRRSVPAPAGRRHAEVAERASGATVAKTTWIFSFSSAARLPALLIWLGVAAADSSATALAALGGIPKGE
jgi:hypothetical protein